MYTQKIFFVIVISSVCGQQIPDIEIVIKNPETTDALLSNRSQSGQDSLSRLKRSARSRVQRLAHYGPSESQEQDGDVATFNPAHSGTNRHVTTHHTTMDGHHQTTIEVEEFDNGYKSSGNRKLTMNQHPPRLIDSRKGFATHSKASYGDDDAVEMIPHSHVTSTLHPSGVQTTTVHSFVSGTTRPFPSSASTTVHEDINSGAGYTTHASRTPKLHHGTFSTYPSTQGFLTTIHPGLHNIPPSRHGVPTGGSTHPQLPGVLAPGNITNHGSYIFSVQTSGLPGNISLPHPQINIVFTGFTPPHQQPHQQANKPSSHNYPEESNDIHPSLHPVPRPLHQKLPSVQHTNISIVHPDSNTSIHITTAHPLKNNTATHPLSTHHPNLHPASYSTTPHTNVHSISYTSTQHPNLHSVTQISSQHLSTPNTPIHTVTYHPTSTPQTVVVHTSTQPSLHSLNQVSSQHPSLLHSVSNHQIHTITSHPLMPTRTPPTVVVHTSTHPAVQVHGNPSTTAISTTNDGAIHISSSSSAGNVAPAVTTVHTPSGPSITIHHTKNEMKPHSEDLEEAGYNRPLRPLPLQHHDEAENSYQKASVQHLQQQHPSAHSIVSTPHSVVSTTIHGINTPHGPVTVQTTSTSTQSHPITHRRRPPTRLSYPTDENDNRLRFRVRAKAPTSSLPFLAAFKDDSDEILHPPTPRRNQTSKFIPFPSLSGVQPDISNLLLHTIQNGSIDQSQLSTTSKRPKDAVSGLNQRRDEIDHLAHLEHSKDKMNVRPSTFSKHIDSTKNDEFNHLPSDVGNKHVNVAQNFPDRKIPYPVVTKTKAGKTEQVQV